MTYKEQLLEAIEDEFRILKHLYTKIPEFNLEFKPAENMRTIFQLLKYLTWSAAATLKSFIEGSADSPNFEIYKELSDEAQDFKADKFSGAMDAQLNLIKELFKKFSDEDLLSKKVMMPFGDKFPLGEAIINTTIKHTTAYKMQLFLYLKILGVKLDTGNCWLGEDADNE